MNILVTGGLGYIGSHTTVKLIEHGFNPIIVDNLANSNLIVLDRIERISGIRPKMIICDMRDAASLRAVFKDHAIDTVIHFAGLKAVGESTQKPLEYYLNNVYGSLNLLQVMQEADVKSLLFSSSATVYGNPASVPITENFPTSTTNPYGTSKLMVEQCFKDFQMANPQWSITLLRYFNPSGAHPSGLIGEDPKGIPNNLVPFVAQVAVGRREKLQVFGGDYPTPDGTGIRDYIHVDDLAAGHVAALKHGVSKPGTHIFNLGAGKGYSVLEVIAAFERASGVAIPYDIVARRPGDVAECWADATLAADTLGWRCELDLDTMMQDVWRWQKQNPQGFQTSGDSEIERAIASANTGDSPKHD